MKGLQYSAQTAREIFDKPMRLAQLSYTDNNVRASGEFIHHCIPFFLALLYFLFQRTRLAPETHWKTSIKRTPRILSA